MTAAGIRGRIPVSRRGAAWFALLLLLFLVLSGCGSTRADHVHHSGLPDNIETTADAHTLPSFLNNYTETTKQFYAQVPEIAHILQELNCYCGCMEYDVPHDSLFRCFIAGVDDNGVHWTDHGASCGICLMEVRDAIKMAAEGKSVDDIKQHIDATYGPMAASA